MPLSPLPSHVSPISSASQTVEHPNKHIARLRKDVDVTQSKILPMLDLNLRRFATDRGESSLRPRVRQGKRLVKGYGSHVNCFLIFFCGIALM